MHKHLLYAVVFCCFLAGCGKEAPVKDDCESLKQGLLANNHQQVQQAIDAVIQTLPSDNYTPENVNQLAQALSAALRCIGNGALFQLYQNTARTIGTQNLLFIFRRKY